MLLEGSSLFRDYHAAVGFVNNIGYVLVAVEVFCHTRYYSHR